MGNVLKQNKLELNKIIEKFLIGNGLHLHSVKYFCESNKIYRPHTADVYIYESDDLFCTIELTCVAQGNGYTRFDQWLEVENGVQNKRVAIIGCLRNALDEYEL
jgi:hypothetical protein